MNEKTGGPAFPLSIIEPDLSIRDYFAAKVLQGRCASGFDPDWSAAMLARDAYALADAMLKERSKP